MSEAPFVDRRRHPRSPFIAGVRLYHATSGRDFAGRCVDASNGGLLLYAPVTSPFRSGHTVCVTIDDGADGRFAHLAGQSLEATVVRVDRTKLLQLGHIVVGLKFAVV